VGGHLQEKEVCLPDQMLLRKQRGCRVLAWSADSQGPGQQCSQTTGHGVVVLAEVGRAGSCPKAA
jgi:hypothetical protein